MTIRALEQSGPESRCRRGPCRTSSCAPTWAEGAHARRAQAAAAAAERPSSLQNAPGRSPQLESRPHPQITCAPDPARATVARGGPAGRHVPMQPGGVHPTLAQDLGGRWELGAGCGSHEGRSGAGPRSDRQLSAFWELDSWVLRKTGRQGAEGLDATQGKRAHPDHCPAWLPQEGARLLISQEGGSKPGRRPRASLGLPWRTSHRH